MSNILHFFFKYLIVPFTILAYVLNIYFHEQFSILKYSYNILLTGSIGFYTNFIAIKLLFHPKEKTFFTPEIIQKHISKIESGQKITDHIFDGFKDEKNTEILKKVSDGIKNKEIKIKISNKLKLKKINNISFDNEEVKSIKDFLEKEEIVSSYINNNLHKIKEFGIGNLISTEIKGFDSDEFEKEAIEVSKNHLKIIELSGGILGLFAGIAIFNIKIFLISVLIIGFLFGLDLLLTKRCKKM